ncbi:hypothetical protein DAPPUDRAFT_333806 [Daphnia pulex]|uniref:Protein kinase domain-containing protein n=1 Tax=Daphnia pulex TaxID=6669 RepID=E9HTW1_DAPPU|nr:hypothetical protein DAPPUDRAFT_333806 [Daphnia pulex]|eukprot:EFX64809.1 hypothetical protein DAPPUDRAFT_333806 [Daphnia pulex]
MEKLREDGKFTIVNNSPIGTFVNGEQLNYFRTLPIDHGDVVALCSAESAASFTFYDNYHSYLGYHRDFNNRYLILSIIASGMYGEVCRAIVKRNNSVVAIKTVHATTCGSPHACVMVNPRGVDALRNEISVLSQLEHPCIVKMLDSAGNWPSKRMFIVMEFHGGGYLQQRMFDFALFSEPNAKYWLVQMVSAIRYCHSRSPPIVHRNLNPANVLLASADEFATVKITDLGLSKLVNDDTVCKTYCGTPLYLAPEVVPSVLRRPYTEAVDVWSIRVMLFLMLSGYNPFDQSNHSASDSLSTSDYIARGNFWLNNKWNSVSLDGKTLVKQMLQIDQKDRPKLKDILSSIWMTDSHVITKVNKIVFAATDTIHH